MPRLANLVLYGNPIYENLEKEDAKDRVLVKIPTLRNLEGEILSELRVEKAKAN